MSNTSRELMSRLDEEKEKLSSDFYLKMSNLLLERNKEIKYKKYEITYIHSTVVDSVSNYDSDGETEIGGDKNEYNFHNAIFTKKVYVENDAILQDLYPECCIEFRDNEGEVYIRKYEQTRPHIMYRVGEYKHHTMLLYNEYTLVSIKKI
jgi:hypothetical protein